MNVIEITRQLGEAIQQDEKYIAFMEAKKANEEDLDLNAMIGKLNLVQMSYQNESGSQNSEYSLFHNLFGFHGFYHPWFWT